MCFEIGYKLDPTQSYLLTLFIAMQCNDDLKAHMQKLSTKPYSERLADFHLLLWLASSSGLGLSDIVLLADAVKTGQPVSEGYRLLIDSIAGL